MFSHILVAIDGSAISMQAGSKAVALARKFKSKMTAVMVSASYRRLTDEGFLAPVQAVPGREWEKGVAERAQAILGRFVIEAKAAGIQCASVHKFNDQPHRAIVETAKKNNCDLIVMGSHGYGGFKQLVLGSETTRVLSLSKIPVLVCR